MQPRDVSVTRSTVLSFFAKGKSQFLDETDAIAWQLLNTREFNGYAASVS